MAKVHLLVPSFNAGELSPLLGARFAVEKVQSGCRLLRNFIPHVHGPAFRRPGTEHIGANAGNGAKSSLRGFNFSTTTGFMLEFHPSGLRVWSNGDNAQLVPLRTPVALPYTETECGELQMAQVNDVTYIAHPNHRPMKLIRYADDDWRLQEITWKWPALGDQNLQSDEIATPNVTLLLQVPCYEWPEFSMTTGDSYTVSVVGSLLPGGTTVKVWQWQKATNPANAKWVLRHTLLNLLGSVNPVTDTVAGAVGEVTAWRLTYTDPLTAGHAEIAWGANTFELPFVEPHESLQSVIVPIGEWQMTVECAADIPAGATLDVQKKGPQGNWNEYLSIALKPGQSVITRGDTLTAAAEVRFLWSNQYTTTSQQSGRAMYASPGVASVMRFESIVFVASTDITLSINSVNGTGRTLTASAAIFQPGHVGSFWQISHQRDAGDLELVSAVPTIVAAASDPIRVSGDWNVFTYGIWDATVYLEREVGGAWEVARSWTSRKDRNVVANGTEEDEVEMRLRVSAGTSAHSDVADVPRFVLEAADALVTGLVKITAVGALNADGKTTTATVDVVTALYSTAATALWTEGAWSDVRGNPRTVTLHEQRLWFGGTNLDPLRLWGSVINDYENFRQTSLDDASVSFVPSAQQSNRLQWMISHGGNLVLGTNGDEWTVSGGTDNGPITPTSVNIQRRSGYGSQYLPAILMGDVIAFVQRGGHKLREVAPRDDVGLDWQADDLTVLAEHVALAGMTQTSAMFFPQSILWAVTADGKLLGMTFEQEQNVFAWHVHETDGQFESVSVVFGELADEVWVQVLRNGRRSIERLDVLAMARQFDHPELLMYLDAAVRVELTTPSAMITGLDHLEGREVTILGDGAEMATARVLGGAVTLERAVGTAIVGLPYTSQLQPMRIDIPLPDGTAQARNWRTSRVCLYLHDSLGGEVADSPDSRFEKLQYRRVATPMDSPPPLYTGEQETAIESSARAGADVIVQTSGALPLNIGSIVLKGDVYGE